jgi:hypothetical protein
MEMGRTRGSSASPSTTVVADEKPVGKPKLEPEIARTMRDREMVRRHSYFLLFLYALFCMCTLQHSW